jgi:predicted nucleic acid-binding protein
MNEVGATALREYIDASTDGLNTFSILADVEVRSALQRRSRNRELNERKLHVAHEKLNLLSQTWFRLGIDERVVGLTAGVIARHALRSLDALQLASPLSLNEALVPGEELLFIACDKRLLLAASAEGLATWNPETSAPPAPIPPVN